MPLKNLGNFWRSLEVPLINCKIQLKLRRIKYCVLFEAASGNDSVNSVNVFFFFSVLDISNYVFLISLCQQKIIKNYQNFLVNDMKDELLE